MRSCKAGSLESTLIRTSDSGISQSLSRSSYVIQEPAHYYAYYAVLFHFLQRVKKISQNFRLWQDAQREHPLIELSSRVQEQYE